MPAVIPEEHVGPVAERDEKIQVAVPIQVQKDGLAHRHRVRIQVQQGRSIAESPAKYHPKVWGEKEVGGTGVLMISSTDLSFLTQGEKLVGNPLPASTAPAMEAVPFAFTTVVGAMAALNWIIRRRIERQKDEHDG